MSKKTVNILIKLAIIIQAIAVALGVIVTAFQKILVPALYQTAIDNVFILSPELIFMGLLTGIYALFFVIYNKNTEGKVSVLVLIIVAALFLMMRGIVITLGQLFYINYGMIAVSMYAALTNIIRLVFSVLGVPAAILFFISAGSYLTDRNR